jgi:hypothetical protein
MALNHRPSLRKAATMNDPFARLPVVPNFTVVVRRSRRNQELHRDHV